MANNEFIIPFVGLKLGVHEFDFEVADAFFEDIEYSLVQKGTVKVKLRLEKKETMLIGDFNIKGEVGATCGRCTGPVDVEIEGDYQLIYKFDDKPSDDETLVIVYPEQFEIDVKESILEFISVSVPSRVVHEEGACNEEMIGILSEYEVFSIDEDAEDGEEWESDEEDDGPIDPRWEALKKLNKK